MSIRCNEEADGQLYGDPIFRKPTPKVETAETTVETAETVRQKKSAATIAALGSLFEGAGSVRDGNTEK